MGRTDVRVLLADDDPLTVRTLAQLLTRAGHDVRTASSASEAVRVGAAWDPEVVVVDLHLGDGDGITVAQSLRRLPGARVRRVVLLSGAPQPTAVDGIDVTLLKPAGVRDVLAALVD